MKKAGRLFGTLHDGQTKMYVGYIFLVSISFVWHVTSVI